MRRGRLPIAMLLSLVAAGGIAVAFRQGLVPVALNPLPAVDLSTPGWFIDWRLAALKHARDSCRRILEPPHIEAAGIADSGVKDGCGWSNSVRLTSAGGARVAADKLSCETAAALALWIAHEVQPLASTLLGQRIAAVQNMGTYGCRNIVGNPLLKGVRSEHATANAIDIGAFTLADGRRIVVQQHWRGAGAEARFLREAHRRACRYFRVALSPEYNASHHDHFHLDRGWGFTCR